MSYLDKILEELESSISIEENSEKITVDLLKESENYFEELLFEASLRDLKKKYPKWTKRGWIKKAKAKIENDIGPRYLSRYLSYFIKRLEGNFNWERDGDSNDDSDEDVSAVAKEIFASISGFHKNRQRLRGRSIYDYSTTDVDKMVQTLGPSGKSKKKKKSEVAREGSEIVYEDNGMFAVRVYTEEASCHYGQGTKWCISATESENYFNHPDYVGFAFIMVRMDNLKDSNPNRKITLVYNREGGFEEAYDVPDQMLDSQEVREAISENLFPDNKSDSLNAVERVDKVERVYRELFQSAKDNVIDNPPEGESIEAQIDELDEEYKGQFEDTGAFHSAEVEEGAVWITTGFEVEIDDDKLIKDIPDEYRAKMSLSDDIQAMLDTKLSIYANEVNINHYGTVTNVVIEFRAEEPSVNGYRHALRDLYDDNKKFKGIQRVVVKVLQEYGYMDKTTFEEFEPAYLEKKLKNFELLDYREYLGEEEISFMSDRIPVKGFEKETFAATPRVYTNDFYDRLGIEKSKQKPAFRYDDNLQRMVMAKLNKFSLMVSTALKRQLPLPGIPQEQVIHLTMPEMLTVYLKQGMDGPAYALGLKLEDIDISEENFNTILGVMKFIDENFDEISKIVTNTVTVFLRSKISSNAAAKELEKIDAEDGTDPVNEYFSELALTDLEKDCKAMTISEWLDPECPAPWDSDFEEHRSLIESKREGVLGKYVWPSADKGYRDWVKEPDTSIEEKLYKELHNHFGAIAPMSNESVKSIQNILASGEYPTIFQRRKSGSIQRGMRVSVAWIQKNAPEVLTALTDDPKDPVDWEPPVAVKPFAYKPEGKFGNVSSWTDDFRSARRFTIKHKPGTIPIIIHTDGSSGFFMHTQAFDRYKKGRYKDEFGIKKLNPTGWAQERETMLFGECEVTAIQINATKQEVMNLINTI